MNKQFFSLVFILQSLVVLPISKGFAHSDATNWMTNGNFLKDSRKNDGFKYLKIDEFVSLDSFNGDIQGYRLGCEQTENDAIGFCGGECTDNVGNNDGATVSRSCAEFIDKVMPICLKKIGCTKAAAFCGVGGHAKRSIRDGKSNSRHSTGDAMDLFGLNCKDKADNIVNIRFDKKTHESLPRDSSNGMNRYEVFVNCWREAVIKTLDDNQTLRGGGAISTPGSIPPTDHNHRDHVHFSCPSIQPNIATK